MIGFQYLNSNLSGIWLVLQPQIWLEPGWDLEENYCPYIIIGFYNLSQITTIT